MQNLNIKMENDSIKCQNALNYKVIFTFTKF